VIGCNGDPDLHAPQRANQRPQKNSRQRAHDRHNRAKKAQARSKLMRQGELFKRRMYFDILHAYFDYRLNYAL
jgi:hypothetical protein